MTDNSDTATETKPKASTAKKSKSRAPSKADAAFRTISEVSEELDIPQHVLRFWETKFTQVKPTKRAGGRRYYRPQDVELLRQIKRLLHDDAFTIKGVQKVLKSARGVSSAIEKAKEAGVDVAAETVSTETADAKETTKPEAVKNEAADEAVKPEQPDAQEAPKPTPVKTASVVTCHAAVNQEAANQLPRRRRRLSKKRRQPPSSARPLPASHRLSWSLCAARWKKRLMSLKPCGVILMSCCKSCHQPHKILICGICFGKDLLAGQGSFTTANLQVSERSVAW